MRILLITDDFYPKRGGIADLLNNFYRFSLDRSWELYVLNPFFKGKKASNKLRKVSINLKTIYNLFGESEFYWFLFRFIIKVLGDRNINPFIERIKIILYPFTKPKIFLNSFINLLNLKKLFIKLNPDIFLSGSSNWLLPFVYLLSKTFNKKCVTFAYGLDFLTYHPLSFKTFYFKYVDRIITLTEFNRSLIKRIHNLNPSKIKVIPCGINIKTLKLLQSKEKLRKKYGISKKQYVLLSVGRHVSRKNFDSVILAINRILKRFPEIKLRYYLAGEGPETENLQNLSSKLDLEKYIKFLGFVDPNTRNEFYKLSDVFIMPSITEEKDIEGFGIVFLEANFFKLPVIGSFSGGIRDVIIDGKTGFLINSTDKEELVNKILFLYDNKRITQKMGRLGHRRVIKQFNWNNLIEDYENFFQTILKNEK